MRLRTITLIALASVLAIITTVNANDFGMRPTQHNAKSNVALAMMGSGGGMMGGSGKMGFQGILKWFESLGKDNQDRQNSWNLPENKSRKYDYQSSRSTYEIETLRKQINAKRKELAALFRSDKIDKAIIDKKIDELSNLERDLDEKISGHRK